MQVRKSFIYLLENVHAVKKEKIVLNVNGHGS